MLDAKGARQAETADCSGPAWHNTPEYPSISSNEFARDLVLVDQLIHQIQRLADEARPMIESFRESTPELIGLLQAHAEFDEQAWTLVGNLSTYVLCERSIDGRNAEALRADAILRKRKAALKNASTVVKLFLIQAPEELIAQYLRHPHTEARAFALREERKLADTHLSEAEETLLEQMRAHAIDAWGSLYDQISGRLLCQFQGKEIGLAEASGLLREESESDRHAAWSGIQDAWRVHDESCAAILNGLAGWRIEEYQRRSSKRQLHYLDLPVHLSRISHETLEAMMSAVEEARPMAQRAMRAMAHGYGKLRMDPWDLVAPAPNDGAPHRRTFKEGLKLLHDAFGAIDPGMADFVDTMEKNRWIEGRILPAKRQGAYCTSYPKSRTPRVFQTYMGSLSDIRTLAHELGHAYHEWVMRDLPVVLKTYPMTLAETASTFAETAFAESFAHSRQPGAQLAIAWQNAESITGLLLNIPARLTFEKSFYQRRLSSGYVTAQELGDLTEAAWREWYGDTISKVDRQYWMTKLHFSLAQTSFYNFPYTFGYLFSLGIFARRKELGSRFSPMYRELLRDTGRMTAEELARHHLDEDLQDLSFWRRSLSVVDEQVTHIEKLVGLGGDA